jgi:O-antigen/teichoic acid export membrane protein
MREAQPTGHQGRDAPGRQHRRRLEAGQGTLIARDITEATAHGDVYLRRLRRAQLGLSLLSLVAFGGLVGALPLLLYLSPHIINETDILGVPLAIWLVVIPPYPLFVAIGWLQQRRADGLDAAFRELVADEEEAA